MRREETPEDRKLLAVKSWFTRSSSSITLQNDSVEAVLDGNSPGVSVSKEGALESGAGSTSLRQLSVRRSRASGEIEKEGGAGSPSMTIKNITPLTPLTPLKWKSNSREQEEEENPMERSRLGSAVPVGRTYDEYSGGKPTAENAKEERAAEGQQQGSPVAGAAAHDRTKSVDELSTKAQSEILDESVSVESFEGPDRRPSSGDDVMTMTIEFLRARLLSERSASKSAKLRVHQLAKEVSELEQKLDQAIEERKKAEVSAQEAFMKLKHAESSNQGPNRTSGEVSDKSITTSTKVSPLSRPRATREDTKYVQQDVSSNGDLSRTNSHGSAVEDRGSNTKKQSSETVTMMEERTGEQGRAGVRPGPQHSSEMPEGLPEKQESRAVIESRLRNTWIKISEEMTALAEERREDDVREELMRWMGQVPSVLQNIIPKKLVSPTHDVHLRSESESIRPQGMAMQTVESQAELSPETIQVKGQLQADAKRVALLHDQLSAQEDVQSKWERNYEESQRKLEQFKGDDHSATTSPNSSAGHRVLQRLEHRHGPNGATDNSSSLGSHLARLAKSNSTLDLPMRPHGYNLDINSSHHDEECVKSGIWNRERARRQGSVGRHYDPMYQNAPAHGCLPLDPTHFNHSRMHQDRSAAPSIIPEDGCRRSQVDFRAEESAWDVRNRWNSGRHGQAQPRDSEREEYYSSSQPENIHRRLITHSDNYDWPAVEDYGFYNQQPEPRAGLERRQSYSGYPAADASRTGFEKALGSQDELRYSDERMYGAQHRRNSYPAAKGDNDFGQHCSTQASRNGYSNVEPTLSLGYGPAYDAPREDSPVQQSPKGGINKNISDVLRALRLAKANIQSGGAGSKERRHTEEQVSQAMMTGYGMEPSTEFRQGPRQTIPEQIRYFESGERGAPLLKPSRAASQNVTYDPCESNFEGGWYQSEGDVIVNSNTNSSYVDQLNVGKGIQFFFA